MKLTSQIAKQFRDLYFGGNWTAVSVKETLKDVNWEQATTKIDSLHTVASLLFHMSYYVGVVLSVLRANPLRGSDKDSFNLPALSNQKDWENLLNKTWTEAEEFATAIENLQEEKLWQIFGKEKYGNYYRNIHGVIEHSHYHLGQIVVIKKLLANH